MNPNIDEFYSYIVTIFDHKTQSPVEVVVAVINEEGVTPLVSADLNRIREFKKTAQEISNKSGLAVKLAKFTKRTDVEVLMPEKIPDAVL